MAFADPQSVTIATVLNTLPRVGSGPTTGAFSNGEGTVKLSVSHQYGKRTRRQARLDVSKVAPDPLISSTNIIHSMSVYMVADVPKTGYTIAEQKAAVDAFIATLQSGAGAANFITKLLGGEN